MHNRTTEVWWRRGSTSSVKIVTSELQVRNSAPDTLVLCVWEMRGVRDVDNESATDGVEKKKSKQDENHQQKRGELERLPCLLQDTSGFGWPCAIHSITAGRPSTTVAFWGGATITTLFRVSVEPGATKRAFTLVSWTSKYEKNWWL